MVKRAAGQNLALFVAAHPPDLLVVRRLMDLRLLRVPAIRVQPPASLVPVEVVPQVDEDRRKVVAKQQPLFPLRFPQQEPE
jgi:hypothetical protein